ncbi:isomerase [Pandoraea cepalis]|uniref:Isomerase n=2 Tax=Pandoraea cepalis TaxID=2508294 RepID=A0AAW7MSX6_9BURK|nr:isomerase [Pandoraea cepalis]MDN4580953.1 isomerase [Pandoraea cepalis]QBC30406.1 nuclear transport factor 2 family protein [Pandoraea sp. XY-2]
MTETGPAPAMDGSIESRCPGAHASMPMDIDHAAALTRLTRYFETLTRQSVGNLGEFYAPNVYLKTPLHEVRSAAEVATLLTHLFERVDVPRIEFTATLLQHNQALLVWNLHFHTKRWLDDEQVIHGASHLRLAVDGRVAYQRDYWDATEDIYVKLPIFGRLLRWLRHRLFR